MSSAHLRLVRCATPFVVCILAMPAASWAQGPARAASTVPPPSVSQEPSLPPSAARGRSETRPLPVRRIVLYKSGVGYFEHVGPVTGNEAITIDLTSGQLDDVLKSLTTVDLGGGRVSGITFNSMAPLEQRLRTVGLPLGERTTRAEVLRALRGSRVEVRRSGSTVVGRVLDVERRTRQRDATRDDVDVVQVVTDDGVLHAVDLVEGVGVRVLDGGLRGDIGAYLDAIAAAGAKDVRRMAVQTSGTGTRDLLVSYVSEVPVWKSTYRLVIPKAGTRRPFLQGWAIVDNALGEDWTNVQLSLVAGAPQSFVQPLSQPLYTRRPVVPVPTTALPTPQTHDSAVREGVGALKGHVADSSGADLPGVTVTAHRGGALVGSVITDANGRFRFPSLSAGPVVITAELTGFRTATQMVQLTPGGERSIDVQMELGGVSESVQVVSDAPAMTSGGASNFISERVMRVAPAPPAAKVAEALGQQVAAAEGDTLGELFEYALKQPVTIGRNQSALVPIVQADVSVERVSLWSRAGNSPRPRRAVWLTNDTGATLDGGAMTLLEEGAFAGEGLIESLKPKERRLVSFAVDLASRVSANNQGGPRVTTRVQLARGLFRQVVDERETTVYTISNDDAAPRTFLIEHPRRPTWALAATAPPPAESTDSLHRFRVVVPAGASQTLEVAEARPVETTLALSSITDDHVALALRSNAISAEQEKQLRAIVAQQREVARIQAGIQQRTQEVGRIEADQRRVRENLGALEGTSAEKALVERYARQLASQEDRLEVLRREIEAETIAQQQAREVLMRLVDAVAIDVTMP